VTLALDRRQFLTGVLGGGVTTGLVRFTGLSSLLSMAEASASTVARNGPFVLCTLYGGNDGLNTVIPYESGIYRDWRPGLAIPGEQVLPLGSDESGRLGFHPSLAGLHSLWKAGKVAIISGVEYPNPNFSHFASQTIWQTARLGLARPLARHDRHRPVPGPVGRADTSSRPGRLQATGQLGGRLDLGRRPTPRSEPRL
jgi:uncharacterized protein (DUF1501 family)